jgi:hypothetical protein
MQPAKGNRAVCGVEGVPRPRRATLFPAPAQLERAAVPAGCQSEPCSCCCRHGSTSTSSNSGAAQCAAGQGSCPSCRGARWQGWAGCCGGSATGGGGSGGCRAAVPGCVCFSPRQVDCPSSAGTGRRRAAIGCEGLRLLQAWHGCLLTAASAVALFSAVLGYRLLKSAPPACACRCRRRQDAASHWNAREQGGGGGGA